MTFRTSTFRTGFAARLAAVALLAGLAAFPAAADQGDSRWKHGKGNGAPAATVGHPAQQVNHRGDRGRQQVHRDRDRRRHSGPPRHVRPPRHFAPPPFVHRDHRYRGHYRYDPAPRYYAPPHRHRHRHPRFFRRYYYHNSYLAPRPIYVVPFHVFDTRPAPVVRHEVIGGADTYCSGGAAPAYAGGSRQAGGTIIGGVVGAVVGSQIGKGDGRLAAVGVGTLIGALIGNDIGRSMDAVDQAYAAGAVNRALETAPTCTTISWDNPGTGHYGAITPTRTFEPSPGRYCREFQQQVVIGGTLQDAYGTACRQPDGSWEIVAEQS